MFGARLKVEWNRPEHKTRLKRGKEHYRLIKLREVRPRSYHLLMKRFIETDVDGLYSKMPLVSLIRDEVIRDKTP
ncbi:MAG: hypothetical protein CMJ83_07395 [Planctomycetes bacterium]|nr:hypothetical protein [Planctomycetota bacterium]